MCEALCKPYHRDVKDDFNVDDSHRQDDWWSGASEMSTLHVVKIWTHAHHAATLSGAPTTSPAMWTLFFCRFVLAVNTCCVDSFIIIIFSFSYLFCSMQSIIIIIIIIIIIFLNLPLLWSFFFLIFLLINHMNLGSRFLTHSTSSITPQ